MSSLIHVTCPQCRSELPVNRDQVGQQVTCTNCLEEFVARPKAKAPPVSPAGPHPGHAAGAPPAGGEADERLRLDDDPTLPSEARPDTRPEILDSNYSFSVTCPLCGTVQSATDEEIGEVKRCPDCDSKIRIKMPSPRRRRARDAPIPVGDEDFRLSDPIATPAMDWMLDEAARELETPDPRTPAGRTGAETTAMAPPDPLEAFHKAEQEWDEAAPPDLPDRPFTQGIVPFLFEPGTLLYWILYSTGLFVELGSIQMAIAWTHGGGQTQFVSVLLRMFAVLFGTMLFLPLATSVAAIVQESANAGDRVENWPGFDYLEWVGESLYWIGGLAWAVLPGAAVAQVLHLLEVPGEICLTIALVSGYLGLVFVYPVAMISSLEVGTPFFPVSLPIWRSLRAAAAYWFTFWLQSILLWGALYGLAWARILWNDQWWLNFFLATGMIGILFLHARLVGRLAWCCQESLPVKEDDEQDARDA